MENRDWDISRTWNNNFNIVQMYGTIHPDPEEKAKIETYLLKNISQRLDIFIENFSGYYTGGDDLESISYGEQEEQIEPEEKEIFEAAGFVINDRNPDLAYYDLTSEGLYISLSAIINNTQIIKILKNLKLI